jgi:hypothetical protein
LPAIAEADDAQSAVGEVDAVAAKEAVLIRTAMINRFCHRGHHFGRRGSATSEVNGSGDSTHGSIPLNRELAWQLQYGVFSRMRNAILSLESSANFPNLTKPPRLLSSQIAQNTCFKARRHHAGRTVNRFRPSVNGCYTNSGYWSASDASAQFSDQGICDTDTCAG